MKLELNSSLEMQAAWITPEHACVVLDDFLADPAAAVEYAQANAASFVAQERSYPGIVLPVGADLMAEIHRFVQREMSRVFPYFRNGIEFHDQFSLATLQPEDFSWVQRLCHTDPKLSEGRVNYAGLLYLFDDPEMGGTGFYRWKDPVFWQEMTAAQREDPEAGLELLREKFRMFREPPSYMTGSNEAADFLDEVPAKFNRFVFYPGDLPHSAQIRRPDLLSPNPEKGRLTLNCFASVLPRK